MSMTTSIPQLTKPAAWQRKENTLYGTQRRPSQALESKPGSKPEANDDLKSLPMPEPQVELGSSPDGLSEAEAQRRLTQYGPNVIEEKKTNPFLKFLTYFWGPITWMTEATVILSAVARHWPDFAIIPLCFWPTPWADSGKNTRRATPSPR